ncbi:uncharacterized protein Dmoj_GI26252, partial [Drosophila mojavensis]
SHFSVRSVTPDSNCSSAAYLKDEICHPYGLVTAATC